MFLKYWKGELAKRDVATRFFRLLRASPASLPPSAVLRPMTPGIHPYPFIYYTPLIYHTQICGWSR
jgi:hypothetical protein